jgi:hypothetical protein
MGVRDQMFFAVNPNVYEATTIRVEPIKVGNNVREKIMAAREVCQ